jgi:hypothetical protein
VTSVARGKEIYNVEMMFVSQHGGCPSTQGGTLQKGEKEDERRAQHTYPYATTTVYYSKRKRCSSSLPRKNKDCYS